MTDAIPFIAKPHAYIATMRPRGCLDPGPDRRVSLCQLVLADGKAPKGPSIAQLYSYRSLLLFRLLSSLPFPFLRDLTLRDYSRKDSSLPMCVFIHPDPMRQCDGRAVECASAQRRTRSTMIVCVASPSAACVVLSGIWVCGH